jgi:hypothetical protein
MPESSDGLLHRLKFEYLRRLARFALVDDVPAPWVGVAPAPESGTNGSIDSLNG